MKSTTILSRLSKISSEKRANKNSSSYKLIAKSCENECDVIRPCWYSGSGRFGRVADYSADVCRLLDLLRVKYEVCNDAPRGGKCGTFIRILHFDVNKTKVQERESAKAEMEMKAQEKMKMEEERKANYIALCNETYNHCRNNGVRIDFAGAKKYAAEPLFRRLVNGVILYNISKSFFHKMAHELQVLNNDGFRRYVKEKALDVSE